MGAHIIDGEFQSDKFPTTPRGLVPLAVKDKRVQHLLWEMAQIWRSVDIELAEDLEHLLLVAGFKPGTSPFVIAEKKGRATMKDLVLQCFRYFRNDEVEDRVRALPVEPPRR